MNHHGADSIGRRSVHPHKGHKTPKPTMFVRRSAPATPFHRNPGSEYATDRRMMRMVKKRKPWIPTTAVKGPGAGPPPYWTRVLERYGASTMRGAGTRRDARRNGSRSASHSSIR